MIQQNSLSFNNIPVTRHTLKKNVLKKLNSLICCPKIIKIMKNQQIRQILIKHFPTLADREFKIQRISGLTNITYAVDLNGTPTYIFKRYSPGCDHSFQHKIADIRYREGIGSKCYVFNADYSIQDFIPNMRHPLPHQMAMPSMFQAIMLKLHKLHHLKISWTLPEDYQTPSHLIFSEQQKNKILKLKDSHLQNNLYLQLFNMICEVVQRKDQYKKLLLPNTNQHVMICHNDLNNLNVLVNNHEVFLIDYDYCAYNFIAYDIANMLNQSCFDYSTQNYPGFVFSKTFAAEQLAHFADYYPGNYAQLKQQLLKFMCVVNFYWAIWSLQRFELNNSSTFGIIQHGIKRMQVFHHYNQLILVHGLQK